MPTEWAKRPEAWETIKAVAPVVTDPLPPELSAQGSRSASEGPGRPATRMEGLSAADLAMIDRVRNTDAQIWLQVASWGQKTKKIHFRLTGIARTMAEYALAGWDRGPSAKQARWALEGLKAFEGAQNALNEDA
jgi:hypothetical protein